jgi:hypothetical protein
LVRHFHPLCVSISVDASIRECRCVIRSELTEMKYPFDRSMKKSAKGIQRPCPGWCLKWPVKLFRLFLVVHSFLLAQTLLIDDINLANHSKNNYDTSCLVVRWLSRSHRHQSGPMPLSHPPERSDHQLKQKMPTQASVVL